MVPHVFCLVGERDDLAMLPALVAAGVDGFQVRAKSLDTRTLTALVRAVQEAVDATVIVNDRLDVALATEADGVHLGVADLAVADARRVAPGMLIGATCRTRAEVVAAAAAGADYVGFGPVFATASKAGLAAPRGLDGVAAATGALPLIAIGGIDASNAAGVRAAGAHGVAAISGIWDAPDPVAAARQISGAITGAITGAIVGVR